MTRTDRFLTGFVDGYMDALAWSGTVSVPEDHQHYDPSWSPTADKLDELFSPELISQSRLDCIDFLSDEVMAILEANDEVWDPGRAGHDFWLTRNGHGCGYWDRGAGDAGDALSAAARVYGEVDLYLGDDGMIHGS